MYNVPCEKCNTRMYLKHENETNVSFWVCPNCHHKIGTVAHH